MRSRAALAQSATDSLPTPLAASDVAAFASARRSEIVAARARATAAAQQPAIVSSLNDPMVMASVDHLPFSLVGINASILVQQDFPLSGVLAYRRSVAEAEARRLSAEVGHAALDVELDALRAFYMLDERRRTTTVLTEQLTLARQLVEVSTARYGAGQASQADVLRAQAEVVRIEAELIASGAEIDGAAAMLNTSLARDPSSLVPRLESTLADGDPPPLADLQRAARAARPELTGARAAQDGAHAQVRVMESMYVPMAFVRAGGSYMMDSGAGAMLMVGVSVPIFRERLRAGVAEAQAMLAMADAERDAMLRMVEGEVASTRAQVVAQRARRTAIRDRLEPLALQGVGAALAGYGAGTVPFVSVIDATRTLLDARMARAMTEANLGFAWARLDRAVGHSHGVER